MGGGGGESAKGKVRAHTTPTYLMKCINICSKESNKQLAGAAPSTTNRQLAADSNSSSRGNTSNGKANNSQVELVWFKATKNIHRT